MSVTWNATDAAVINAGFVTTYTFLGRAIGTASATRQVLVAASVGNAAGVAVTLSCTIGGVSATRVTSGESSTSGNDVALFQLNVTSGTTADIAITSSSSGGINSIAIGVGALDGVNAAPASIATPGTYAATQGSPYATGSAVTVPSGGICIGAAGVANAPGTPGWNNITPDATATIAGTNQAVTMGHITTAGSITPSAVFGNFAQEVTLAAVWNAASAAPISVAPPFATPVLPWSYMRERASGILEPVKEIFRPKRPRLFVPGFVLKRAC